MMAKKKSLPTLLKEALNYHAFHHDIPQDADYKALLTDLNRLDRKVADVKRAIVRNRKSRELAAQQAEALTQSLNRTSETE